MNIVIVSILPLTNSGLTTFCHRCCICTSFLSWKWLAMKSHLSPCSSTSRRRRSSYKHGKMSDFRENMSISVKICTKLTSSLVHRPRFMFFLPPILEEPISFESSSPLNIFVPSCLLLAANFQLTTRNKAVTSTAKGTRWRGSNKD